MQNSYQVVNLPLVPHSTMSSGISVSIRYMPWQFGNKGEDCSRELVNGPEPPGTRPLQLPAAGDNRRRGGYLRNLSRLLPVQFPAVAAHPKGLAPNSQHFGQLRFAALILIFEHNTLHILFNRQGCQ